MNFLQFTVGKKTRFFCFCFRNLRLYYITCAKITQEKMQFLLSNTFRSVVPIPGLNGIGTTDLKSNLTLIYYFFRGLVGLNPSSHEALQGHWPLTNTPMGLGFCGKVTISSSAIRVVELSNGGYKIRKIFA